MLLCLPAMHAVAHALHRCTSPHPRVCLPAYRALRLWVPLLATVVAVKAGERLTGPCLNPVFSLSWLAAFPQQQGMAEHLAVFWAAPVAAGIFGGWAFKGWQQQQQRAAVQGGGSAAKQAGHRAKRD